MDREPETYVRRPRAAVLAVGTEITDGQIIDRNSAWISQQLVAVGIDVFEHRSLPDERKLIADALRALAAAADFLFVTGGLGPTSDDFTREVVADVFARPLEFDAPSWQRVCERLQQRGVIANEAQRQQCYFPRGAEILLNTAGTANAFTFAMDDGPQVFVLPGPPAEIEAVWLTAIDMRLRDRVPPSDREQLFIWRCLGKGEGDVASICEEIVRGSGLRIGYRAHVPYVEVKVWVPVARLSSFQSLLDDLETALRPWLVNRGNEDFADDLLLWLQRTGRALHIHDSATKGMLAERLQTRLRETRLFAQTAGPSLTIVTDYIGRPDSNGPRETRDQVTFVLAPRETGWAVAIFGLGPADWHEVPAVFNYVPSSERACRYIAERALQIFVKALRENEKNTG